MSYLVFDIETLHSPDESGYSWGDPQGLGFGLGCIYDSRSDHYRFYGPQALDRFQYNLREAADNGCRLVSWNGEAFDLPILFGKGHEERLPQIIKQSVDLMHSAFVARHGDQATTGSPSELRGLSLDGVAHATLNRGAWNDGMHAPMAIREGRTAWACTHCLQDVRLTRQLYEHARRQGYLLDASGNRLDMPWLKEDA